MHGPHFNPADAARCAAEQAERAERARKAGAYVQHQRLHDLPIVPEYLGIVFPDTSGGRLGPRTRVGQTTAPTMAEETRHPSRRPNRGN